MQDFIYSHLIGQLLTNRNTIHCWNDRDWVYMPPNQLFIISEIEYEYEDDSMGVFIQWGEKFLGARILISDVDFPRQYQAPGDFS
jgi:hypothetical protein